MSFIFVYFHIQTYNNDNKQQGRIQDFHLGGGGGAHITSAKPEVPYGLGPGPA